MNLLVAILFQLGVYASPDLLVNPDFVIQNRSVIDRATYIIVEERYRVTEGGIVIDTEVSP